MSKLLSLLQLSDPALPIGGFSHSNGLETFVQQGLVHDKATAMLYVQNQLKHNIAPTDAALASVAYEASGINDAERLIELDQQSEAVKLALEVRLASRKMGTRLLKIFQSQIRLPELYRSALVNRIVFGHYAVVFGAVAACLDIEKKQMLSGFLHNAAVGMITNAVKLIPLGQMAGQEILFVLQPEIDALADDALNPDQEMIGVSCASFDIRCMQHEELYSRLYMS